MKLLAAPEVTEAAAVASILIAAGLTFDEPETGILNQQKNVIAAYWPAFEAAYKKYADKRKTGALKAFQHWCKNPPRTSDDDSTDEQFDAFTSVFCTREVANKIKKDTTLTDEEIKVMVGALAWIKSGSNTAFLAMRKYGFAIGLPPSILALLAAETSSQEKPARELTALFKKLNMAVPPNLRLDPLQVTELRNKNAAAGQKYSDLRKQLLASYNAELQNYCRAKGGPQPVDEVRRHMQQRGFVATSLPEGFFGKIGDDGRLYTTEGLEIKVKTGTRVRMNPKYDPKEDNGYVFTYKPYDGAAEQYAFTLAWDAKKRQEKFAVSRELEEKLEAVQKKYRADLRSTDRVKRTLATMLELQYITAMRIGNPGNQTRNKDGTIEPTYGLSTLQVQHVKKRGSGLLITFPGKAGVLAKYVIQPVDPILKLVVKNVQELMTEESEEGEKVPKAKTAFVFEDKRGRYNGERVNKYLRGISGIAKLTNHKIRHMRGTMAAREIMRDAPKRVDQKQAEAWFKEAMTKVGALLNHVKGVGSDQKVTPLTAIKNYIDPELSLGFFRERGLRIPKFLAPLMRKT